MRCRWHPPGLYLEKLGGFAPEWVVLLRNRAMLEACFGGKIAILGGFAPEFLSGLFTQILGGHAPVRALLDLPFLLDPIDRHERYVPIEPAIIRMVIKTTDDHSELIINV